MAETHRLEHARSGLLLWLRRGAGLPQLGAVAGFVRRAEDLVLAFVTGHARSLAAAAGGLRVAGNELVDPRGVRYLLSCVEAGRDRTVLDLSLVPLSPHLAHGMQVSRSRRVAAPGRFRRLEINLPELYADAATPLADHGAMILDTGYAWITERIMELVDSAQRQIAEGLYELCRDLFPEPELRGEVWFATVGPVFGFRLISAEVTRSALETMARNTQQIPLSPLDLLGELLQTRLPRELLLMNTAAKSDEPMDVDLAHAGYTRSGSRYALVLTTLYGGSSFTILPLLRREQLAVMALFPTGRPAVRDRLLAHRPEFAHQASLLADEIIEAAELFEVDPQAGEPPAPTENVGRVLGSAVDDARHETSPRRAGRGTLRLLPLRRAA